MRVRWTIVVEGSTLPEMRLKAEHAYTEWFNNSDYKDSLIPEPIFLDAELDEDDPTLYKAWASRNFEVVDK